jgi:hypothetical protein
MVQPRGRSEKTPITIGQCNEIPQARFVKLWSPSVLGSHLWGTAHLGAMTGFLLGLSNTVALLFGAAAAIVGYLGFLVGLPVVGSQSGSLGLRAALALVVVARLVISFAASNVMAEIV